MAPDRIFPWLRGRVSTPTLMFDKTCMEDVPIWVEWFHVFAGGCGIGVPSLEAPTDRKLPDGTVIDISKGFSHGHDFDELFLYIPADPHDTLNLGGQVETWLGEGEEAEKFRFTEATSIWCPANLHHNPNYYRRVDAEKSYFMIVIALTKAYYGQKNITSYLAKPFEW